MLLPSSISAAPTAFLKNRYVPSTPCTPISRASTGGSLSAYLRAVVEVTLISVDQISYLEFLKLMSDPTLCCTLSMAPMHGNLGLELNPSMIFPAIDMLLGGTGKSPLEHRTLTEIEIQIAEGVVKLALRDLKEAWRSALEVNPMLESSETRPQMLQLAAPGESVVAVGLEVKIGDAAGMLNLCIPSAMLKMNRAGFDQQKRHRTPDTGESETEKISGLLRCARITLASEIRDQALAVEDLAHLGVGDIIQLNHAVGDSIQLRIGGVPKFCGRIVARRGKRAFEISHKYVY